MKGKFFSIRNCQVLAFQLKIHFSCLQRATAVKLDKLPQVTYLRCVFYKYFQNKIENLAEQNLMSSLSFQKGFNHHEVPYPKEKW